MSPSSFLALTPNTRRAICIAAGGVTESTLRRYLRGDEVRPVSAQRIEGALRTCGLPHLVRATATVALTTSPVVR